ncbi:MAG: 3'(2'),5'-bisphosphate nucleotidase CysQ [Pseudomonadota bacterium]
MSTKAVDDLSSLMHALEPAVRKAGEAVQEIYGRICAEPDITHQTKSDGSPVTAADQAAEDILLEAIEKHCPGVRVISEENAESHRFEPSDDFFLVDPLDGTREFLKHDGKGCFTVNLALIVERQAICGQVFAPALDRMFCGVVGKGATENGTQIVAEAPVPGSEVALVSVSHRDPQTDEWLRTHAINETRSVGSSLKFALLACGEAHLYPRMSSIMEWDIAAGHAVLEAAGGRVVGLNGQALRYGNENYRAPSFVAHAPMGEPAGGNRST